LRRLLVVVVVVGTFRTWLILPTRSAVGGEADLTVARSDFRV
jgi:hypothetical protein